jgi:hypothetical protein
MTPTELSDALTEYTAGLEAEVPLLHHLLDVAVQQRDASPSADLEALTRLGAEREMLTAKLLDVEARLRHARTLVERWRRESPGGAAFERVASLRHAITALVADITSCDDLSRTRLRATVETKRAAASESANSSHMLAAYRQLVGTRPQSATFIKKRA